MMLSLEEDRLTVTGLEYEPLGYLGFRRVTRAFLASAPEML